MVYVSGAGCLGVWPRPYKELDIFIDGSRAYKRDRERECVSEVSHTHTHTYIRPSRKYHDCWMLSLSHDRHTSEVVTMATTRQAPGSTSNTSTDLPPSSSPLAPLTHTHSHLAHPYCVHTMMTHTYTNTHTTKPDVSMLSGTLFNKVCRMLKVLDQQTS